MAGGQDHEVLANLGGSGERDLADPVIPKDRVRDHRGVARYDVQDTPGKPRLLGEGAQGESAERRLAGGLDHDGAARGEGRADLTGDHGRWEVPRRDRRGDTHGLAHDETVKLRRNTRDDFLVSNPFEGHWLADLRQGGQVQYGAFFHIVYGKKRHLLEEYTALARGGQWDAAYAKWKELEPVRDLLDELMLGPLSKTFTYATTIGNVKAWYDAMGLAAGPVRSPIRQVSPEKREEIKGRLQDLGVI